MILIRLFLIVLTLKFAYGALKISRCSFSINDGNIYANYPETHITISSSELNLIIDNEDILQLSHESVHCPSSDDVKEISAEFAIKWELNAGVDNLNKAIEAYFIDLCSQQINELKTTSVSARFTNSENVGIKINFECENELKKCLKTVQGVLNNFQSYELEIFYHDEGEELSLSKGEKLLSF